MAKNVFEHKYSVQSILNRIFDETNLTLAVNLENASTTKSSTIANGAALSAEIDLESYRQIAIYMPSTWTTANLTFQGSNVTGGTFQNIYDSAGNELTITAAASRILTDIPELSPFRYIKIRSGTSGTPVNQGGARTIILILKT